MSDKSQNYISRVHFKGYKSIKDLEIDLKPGLNIIIGPNGSGKTNFLEFLFKTRSEHAFDEPGYSLIEVEQIDKERVTYQWSSELSDEKGVKLIYTKRQLRDGSEIFYRKWRFFEDTLRQEPPFEQKGDLLKSPIFWNFPSMLKFGIPKSFDKTFAEPNRLIFSIGKDHKIGLLIKSESGMIPLLFANIFINKIHEVHESEFNNLVISKIDFSSINKTLSNYSSIEKIRLDTKRIIEYIDNDSNTYVIENFAIQFFVAGKWLYWHQLSDGTKRIFYIISEITYRDFSILLEEPELGIHPDQLYKIMDFLKEQSKEKQIILTTHSPEVLNTLDKDELDRIIVTRYDPEKGTQMHHLSAEHIEKAKVYMEKTGFLSDFWVHSNLEEYETAE